MKYLKSYEDNNEYPIYAIIKIPSNYFIINIVRHNAGLIIYTEYTRYTPSQNVLKKYDDESPKTLHDEDIEFLYKSKSYEDCMKELDIIIHSNKYNL